MISTNSVYLKVKIKTLAAESRFIRKEEVKNKYRRESLTLHRKIVVRHEARHNLLAYGFIRGRTYSQLERDARTEPDWKHIKKLVNRFGVQYTGADGCFSIPLRTELSEAKLDQESNFTKWVTQAKCVFSKDQVTI